jgi:hypothetical protein
VGSHRQLRQPLAAFKVRVCLCFQVPKTTLRVQQQPASSATQRRTAAARHTLQYQRLVQQLGVPSGGLVPPLLPMRRQLRQRPSNSALDGGVKQHSAQRAAEFTSPASAMRRQRRAAGRCYLTAALLFIALMCMLCCAQLAAAQPDSGSPGGTASGSSTGSGTSRPTAAPKLCINNSECATWYPDMCQLTAATHALTYTSCPVLARRYATSIRGKQVSSGTQRICPHRAVMHRVIWTPARLAGPNCNSACRSYGGGSNRSFMAVNTGTGVRPYFLCRAPVSGRPHSTA